MWEGPREGRWSEEQRTWDTNLGDTSGILLGRVDTLYGLHAKGQSNQEATASLPHSWMSVKALTPPSSCVRSVG